MSRLRHALRSLVPVLVLVLGCTGGDGARDDGGPDLAGPDAGPDVAADVPGPDAAPEAAAEVPGGDAADAETAPEAPEPLDLEESPMPFEVPGASVRFYQAVPYGPEPANLFDLMLVDSDLPTPLAIFIHGGGFTGGSRLAAWQDAEQVGTLLAAGISVATIDYTLLPGPRYEGVIQCLSDASRALQFLRWEAPNLNLDPARVVLFGESAGAGTSLWLAFSDDRADPASPDPVLRQSTRVLGAAVWETQSTYDIVRWEEVLAKYGLDLETRVGADADLLVTLLVFYGIGDVSDLYEPDLVEYRRTVDMLGLMSADDPPFWVRNRRPDEDPVATDLLLHHPLHAAALQERAAEVGVQGTFYVPGMGIADASGLTAEDFLIARVQGEGP